MRSRVAPALCLCAVLVAAVAVPVATAQETPGWRLLLAQWEPAPGPFPRQPYWTALVMGRDGSTQPLTEGTQEYAEAWAPDGALIALNRGLTGLWVAEPDGGNLRLVVEDAVFRSATWAPDARRLAVARATDGEGTEIIVARVDGGAAHVVVPADGRMFASPTWSPDAAEIAFAASGQDGLADIWVVSADGGAASQLTAGIGVTAGPVWSPDGSRIAFVARHGDEPQVSEPVAWLGVVDPRDGAVSEVGEWIPDGGSFAWSPDGSRIAYGYQQQGSNGDEERGIAVVAADGGGPVASFGSDVSAGTPAWTPDGSTVFFRNDLASPDTPEDQVFYASGPDGSDRREISAPPRSGIIGVDPGPVRRVGGRDRIGTAVLLSEAGRAAADAVVLARADDYPDALAGAPLAAAVNGPLLLTTRENLHPSVAAEIARLGTSTAYLLGGATALSETVASEVAALGVEVRRLAGRDRFDTAAQIAETLDAASVYLVRGADIDPARGWPDAVSVSALAASEQRPILLAASTGLPPATSAAVDRLGVEEVTIVGGTAAVSQAVEADLAGRGIAVARVAGRDRFETSLELAQRSTSAGLDPARPWLSTGWEFPDGLAAGAAAASDGGVLLLVDGRDVEAAATRAWFDGSGFAVVTVVGGPGAITPPAYQQVVIATH